MNVPSTVVVAKSPIVTPMSLAARLGPQPRDHRRREVDAVHADAARARAAARCARCRCRARARRRRRRARRGSRPRARRPPASNMSAETRRSAPRLARRSDPRARREGNHAQHPAPCLRLNEYRCRWEASQVRGASAARMTRLAALGAVAGAIALFVVVLPNHGGNTTVGPTADSPRQHIAAQERKLKKLPAEARDGERRVPRDGAGPQAPRPRGW